MTGLPGGLVDPGDGALRLPAAEAAARRELLEETGFGGGQMECLIAAHPNPSNQSNTVFCFLGTDLVRQRPIAAGEAVEVIQTTLCFC
ncbi:MAG: NUDIX domain-containing protein [Acetobacteraceae bacterium]